nr:MAG TPA: hypothetical protein [Caudoviricetes sp.]
MLLLYVHLLDVGYRQKKTQKIYAQLSQVT